MFLTPGQQPTQQPSAPANTGGAPPGSFAMPSTSNGAQPNYQPIYNPAGPYPQGSVPQQQPQQQFQAAPAPFATPMPQGFLMPPVQQPQQQQPQQQQPFQQQPFNDGLILGGPASAGQTAYQPAQQFAQPSAPAIPQQQFFAPQQPPAFAATPFAPAPGQFQQPFQQPQPASTMIRDTLVQQGRAVGHYRNDQELLADLGEGASELTELRHYASIGRQQVNGQALPGQQPPAIGQQQQPGQQPGQQQQPQTNRNGQPEWRDEWRSQVQFDAQSGRYVAADQYSNPRVVQQANELAEWRRRRAEQIATNPADVAWNEGLQDRTTAVVKQAIEDYKREQLQQVQREQGNQLVSSYLAQHQHELVQFAQNQQGQAVPLVDQFGQYALTAKGHAMKQHASNFVGNFKTTYGREPLAHDIVAYVDGQLARDAANGAFAQQQAQQQPQQQQIFPQYPQQQQLGYQPQQPGMQFAQPQQQFFDPNEAAKQQLIARTAGMNGAIYQPNMNGATISPGGVEAPMPATTQALGAAFRDAAIRKGLVHPQNW